MFTTRSALLVLTGVLIPGLASADISFLFAPQVLSGVAPYAAEVVDVDGDGDKDIVTANVHGDGFNSISVLKNNGGGTYSPPVAYQVGEDPMNIASGDFNGDGRMDLVVANAGSGDGGYTAVSSVSVLLNLGNGVFGPQTKYLVGENARPEDVEVADFNGDQILDLAVACSVGYTISVYRGNGNGTFALQGHFNADSPQAIDTADFDRDGDIDIVYCNVDAAQVMRNNGASFSQGIYISNFPTGCSDIVAADFNGDSAPDFATTGRSLTIYTNNGTGTSFAKTQFDAAESQLGVDTADFDNDGDADIVTANYLANSVSVYSNNGAGVFSTRADWGVGPNPWGIAVGDIDTDSKIDIVAPNSQLSQTNVTVVRNLGNNTFFARREYWLTGYARGVEVADFNADGRSDVVSGVYVSNQDNVAVFFGLPNGSLQEATYLENLGNNIPTDVAVGYFNADNLPDIVASIFSPGNRVRVFINQGGGNFAPNVGYEAGGNPSGVDAGDLNGDGMEEIICTNGSQSDSSISIFINNGDGTFAPSIRIQVLLRPSDVAIEDLDGDNDNDVVVSHGGDQRALFFRNDGSGNLGAPVPLNVGNGQGDLVLEDMNGDGSRDIVLAAGLVTILFNSGSGTYGAPQQTAVPAARLDTADFDLDGDLDVVGTDYVRSFAHIGSNDGNGQLSLVRTMVSGFETDRVAARDVDNDGLPDVLTANGRAGSISVFKNTSNVGQLLSPTSYTLQPGVLVLGNLQSLLASDENRMVMRPGVVLVSNQPPISLTVQGTAPTPAAQMMSVVVESSASTSSIEQWVDAYNFQTGQFDSLTTTTLSVGDVRRTYSIPNPSAHIGPGNIVRCRIRFKANGPVLVYPWQARVDELTWRIVPQ